jgi:hypothetical protein
MGSKADCLNVVVELLCAHSQLDRENGLMRVAGSGLSRATEPELKALLKVLNRAFTIYEERIEAANRHGVAEQVPKDLQAVLIEYLSKSTQTGEAEHQLDTAGGLVVNLRSAWQSGDLGNCKTVIACLEKITGNIKRVIKAQLYSNLK